MYTGIIEEKGVVQTCSETGLVISARLVLADLAVKDSIAVDGICLTVIELGPDWFHVDTMPETLRRTTLGDLQPGSLVNLERSVPVQGRLGGHIVQGHIEASVSVLSIKEDGIGLDVEIELPSHLRPYVISKGFVALNGASLTVVEASEDRFSISLIPYTREQTNLGLIRPGTRLNLETDILGRYVVQLLNRSTDVRTSETDIVAFSMK
jgi:riboflavin synthase